MVAFPVPARDEAVRAAVAVASGYGVRCDDPVVLADGFNIVVHLRPARVVARVVRFPALLRSNVPELISRELAVAAFLAGQGVLATRPTNAVPARPHERDGLWMSFWEHLEVRPGFAGPADFARNLRNLHDALRDHRTHDTPLDTAFFDVEAFLRRGGKYVDVSDEDTRVIAAELDRLRCGVAGNPTGPLRQLHGDAHPGNLLRTPEGWCWTDFEESMRGPIGWDLACLEGTTRIDGRAALRAYGMSEEDVEPFRRLRRLQAISWFLLLAGSFPAHGERARTLLDQLR